jgi:hypothetical protein
MGTMGLRLKLLDTLRDPWLRESFILQPTPLLGENETLRVVESPNAKQLRSLFAKDVEETMQPLG